MLDNFLNSESTHTLVCNASHIILKLLVRRLWEVELCYYDNQKDHVNDREMHFRENHTHTQL